MSAASGASPAEPPAAAGDTPQPPCSAPAQSGSSVSQPGQATVHAPSAAHTSGLSSSTPAAIQSSCASVRTWPLGGVPQAGAPVDITPTSLSMPSTSRMTDPPESPWHTHEPCSS
ncbi:MAG TPA: hypothetical protein VKB80_22945 [Kofleriaceae bacterium]|nr:hypothetical protein [Kofleriaceae bacterium]